MPDQQMPTPGGTLLCPYCGGQVVWTKLHPIAVNGHCEQCARGYTLVLTLVPPSRLPCLLMPNEWSEPDEPEPGPQIS